MPDNVGYTPGSGAIVAADDIGGVLHQRIKLALGADGTNDGDLSASNPMPVTGSVAVTTATPLEVTASTPLNVDVANVVTVTGAATDETAQDMVLLLTRMLNYFNAPQGYDKSLQRYRQTAVLESGTVTTVSTVTTVTTVGAVSSLNAMDGYQTRMLMLDTNRTSWFNCVRTRIT